MIMNETILSSLKAQFQERVRLVEKRPGIFQALIPAFHADGDMLEMFIEQTQDGRIRISDYGMTLMRLSYEFELGTEHREKIFRQILGENYLSEDNGRIFMDADLKDILSSVLRFSHGIAKVSNLRLLKREKVRDRPW